MSDGTAAWIGFAFAVVIVGLTQFVASIRERRAIAAMVLGSLTMIGAALHGAYLGLSTGLPLLGPLLALAASFAGSVAAVSARKREPALVVRLTPWSAPAAALGLLLVLFISRRTLMYFAGA